MKSKYPVESVIIRLSVKSIFLSLHDYVMLLTLCYGNVQDMSASCSAEFSEVLGHQILK